MSEQIASYIDGRVSVHIGDITGERVNAVVNAANWTLLGGGGVDGAIHNAGGAEILEACQELRRTLLPEGLPTGDAVITTGGKLPARFVIHTVGPIWGHHNGQESDLLAACYRNSLRLAVEHDLHSICFPAISTGAYSYPAHLAAKVVSKAVRDFLRTDSTLEQVRLIFLLKRDANTFLKHQDFHSTEENT